MTVITVNDGGSISLPQWALEHLWAEEGTPLHVHADGDWIVMWADGVA